MLATLRTIKSIKSAHLKKLLPQERRCNTTLVSETKNKGSSLKRKFGVVVGISVAIPGVWYLQADKQQQRKARVTFQGVGRFLRYDICTELLLTF